MELCGVDVCLRRPPSRAALRPSGLFLLSVSSTRSPAPSSSRPIKSRTRWTKRVRQNNNSHNKHKEYSPFFHSPQKSIIQDLKKNFEIVKLVTGSLVCCHRLAVTAGGNNNLSGSTVVDGRYTYQEVGMRTDGAYERCICWIISLVFLQLLRDILASIRIFPF